MAQKHICLITPGHVSSCPRIVKEADALVEAGYEVTLVSGRNFEPVVVLDRDILSRARWNHCEVPTSHGLRAGLRRLARKGLQLVRPHTVGAAAAEFFVTPGLTALIAAVVQTKADFYHAHCLGGLPAAAAASRVTRRPFSFDVEDFHEEESDAVLSNPTERAAVARLMKEHLPRAAFVTAASPLIAERCSASYGVNAVPLLNAFAPLQDPAVRGVHLVSKQAPACLYWFSQTVGPGRGLEEMIDVIALMKTPVVLQLRGFVSESYKSSLLSRGASQKVAIDFLEPGSPEEMVQLAAEADLGLSLEQSSPPNRDICLTNKVFVYLAAGIPQLMSKTRAQAAFGREIGAAAILADMSASAATAQKLDALLGDPVALDAARQQAVAMGERFSWQREKRRFVELVNKAVFR